MREIFVNFAFDRVDALFERIDAEFFAGVGYFTITAERDDSVLVVGFDLFRKAGVMSEPQIEEVGVRRHTSLFFEFGKESVEQ